MAKLRGTTRKAGKTRTQPPARDVTSRIEGPHSGKSPRKVGAQTGIEAHDLRGPSPGPGKVREVGATEVPKFGGGGPSSVRVVGGGNFEDQLAAQGGELRNPASRQGGSVKQVGPSDLLYERLRDVASRQPVIQTQQARFAPKKGRRLDTHIPLLKSGVGRAHAWSVYAGQPGSKRAGLTRVGASSQGGEQVLVNGRKRAFGPEAFDPRRDLVEPESVIQPGGGTRRF